MDILDFPAAEICHLIHASSLNYPAAVEPPLTNKFLTMALIFVSVLQYLPAKMIKV